MKDLFGNDKNRNMDSMGNRSVENDPVYRDRGEGMTNMNNDTNKALVGIFETENEAINVIKRLKEIGYTDDKITVLAKDKGKMDRLDNETNVDTKSVDGDSDGDKIGGGAVVGGALGGIAAAIPALGLLAIPGIGPFLAAGPIAAILTGVVAGGVAGGLIGALAEMGVGEEDAKEYEYQLQQGKIIVLVENRDNLSDEVYSTYNQNNSIINKKSQRR